MKYYFGFDGGATKCRFAISNKNGELLFKKEGESSNIYAVNTKSAISTITTLIEEGINFLKITKYDLHAGCFGSAGLSRKKDIEFFRSFFNSYLPNSLVYLCSDAEILLVGGLKSLSGISLIGGTGSVCFGRTPKGEIIRSGGFGWRLGDEGSGWHISNTAISRTLKSKELRDIETTMDKYILHFFKIKKLEDIISIINNNSTTKSDIGNFASFVTKAAEQKDLLAIDILEKTSLNLFELVNSVIKRMPEIFDHKIIIAGGVLVNNKLVQASFLKKMKCSFPEYKIIIDSENSALNGALLIAQNM